ACRDGCSKAAKACGMAFDLQSCNASCGALDGGTTTQPMIPEACKPKADAYSNCTKNAQVTCPDGMHPQVTGCEMQFSDFTACLQSASKGDGGTSTKDSGASSTCASAGDICFADSECCSKSCDMDTYACN